MNISKKLYIKGRVQGVWYRASAQKKALEYELNGFVTNRLDGSVYAEVEGDPNDVEDFIQWCWKGPANAMVKEVEAEDQEVQGYSGFEVRK